MHNNTANLNIMIKAARKASRSLIRDFNEIEKLQVVSKKAGDFVSKADLRAEKIIKEELISARPSYGWCAEESNEIQGCLLYTSPSPRDMRRSRMPSSA